MEFDLNRNINKRVARLDDMRNKAEEKIKSLPCGRIMIKKRKSGIYYYQYINAQKCVYLKKANSKVVNELIQKGYLEDVLKAIKSESLVLKRIQNQYPKIVAESIYENLDDERKKLVRPIVPTDDQYVRCWQERPYTPKPISKDVPVYITMKGERVRSKSEMIIADRLFVNGIPYKYECPLMVGDNEIIHPDFTILRIRDRKIIYYEHCGKMDDPGYAEEMVERSVKYSLAGIVQGDSLFYTYESSTKPLDVRVLDNMIKRSFM